MHGRFDILFETARFNCSEVKAHFINDCCFGEDLAAWLKDRLKAKGMQTKEPYQEDWGWELSVTDSARSYYVGVGGYATESFLCASTPINSCNAVSAAAFHGTPLLPRFVACRTKFMP